MLQNLSGKEMAFFCNIIICSNEKFWPLFKLFNKITFEIMKPIYIPSFINAQAILICCWSFKESTNLIEITDQTKLKCSKLINKQAHDNISSFSQLIQPPQTNN